MQIFVPKLELYPVGYTSSLAPERGYSSAAIRRQKRRLSSASSPLIRVMGHRVTPHQSTHSPGLLGYSEIDKDYQELDSESESGFITL